MLKDKSIVDIRAVKLKEASALLVPALTEIYIKYGLDLTTTLLMYYSAKGIIMSKDFSKQEKTNKLKQATEDFLKAIKVLNKVDKQD